MFNWSLCWRVHLSGELTWSFHLTPKDSQQSSVKCHPPKWLRATSLDQGQGHHCLLREQMVLNVMGMSVLGVEEDHTESWREKLDKITHGFVHHLMCHIAVSVFLLWQFSTPCKYLPYNCLKNNYTIPLHFKLKKKIGSRLTTTYSHAFLMNT